MNALIDRETLRRRLPFPLKVAFAGTLALLLSGCIKDFAGFGCQRLADDTFQVAENAKCKFRYGRGDTALYSVKVVRAPLHGEATAKGPYLHYVARPGFVGEDRVQIRVARVGLGGVVHQNLQNVQWQNITVKIKVGSKA